MPIRFLASVRTVAEAKIAAGNGADIIDCKEPRRGALGALGLDTITAICAALPRGLPVSATIGDDVGCGSDVEVRVAETAAAGVDYVKVGIDGAGRWQDLLSRIGTLDLGACRLVAVVLADRPFDFDIIAACADANCAGVLLDTGDKMSGALPDILEAEKITEFVRRARNAQLFAGLAGALGAHHIADVAAYTPDILGFRSALCADGGRKNDIEPQSVRQVRAMIDQACQVHQHVLPHAHVL